ncbi:MAG TPA: hypothetical protein VNO55_11910 [Polyangia bacterium]|nr:hypothetical protein [Polyangia bacterium]
MADPGPRDWWGKFEIIFGAVGALGSIAIPVALFVVGSGITERQRLASDKQIEADRVEKMLTHLSSDNADERKLTVRVLGFLVSENQFPAQLLPAINQMATADGHEDVANSAAEVLETATKSAEPTIAKAAQTALAALPARINIHSPDKEQATAAAADLAHTDVVVSQQATGPQSAATTELRYYRNEDANRAEELARRLQTQGIKATASNYSKSQQVARPRSFDLVFGKK